MSRRQTRVRETDVAYRAVAPRAAALHSKARSHPTGPAHAKLFSNGRSQAVRLPKEFRMPGTEVLIRREGDLIILEPLPVRAWSPDYFDSWTAGSTLERQQPAAPAARRLVN